MASSPFAAYDGEEIELAPVRGDSGAPTGLAENYWAGRDLQDADNTDYQNRLYDEAFGATIAAVNAVRAQEGLPRFLPPSWGDVPDNYPISNSRYQSAYGYQGKNIYTRDQVADALVADVARIRKARPDFLSDLPATRELILSPYIAREQAKRAKARDVIERGDGAGAMLGMFGGGMTKAMEDPWNILTLPLGGGGKTILQVGARTAIANGLVEWLSQPVVEENRELLGEELTTGEAVMRVGFAAGGGALLGGLIAAAGKYGGRAWDQLTPLEQRLAKALEAAEIVSPTQLERQVIADILGTLDDGELVALSRQVGASADPTIAAASAAIERQGEVDANNPYIAGSGDTYADRLSMALEDVLRTTDVPDYVAAASRAIGEPGRTVDGAGAGAGAASAADGFEPEALKGAIRGPESGGNDRAVNAMGSSASGRYQFVEGTFKSYYRRVYGGSAAAADAAWANKRFDVDVQERLMDALIADNSRILREAGLPRSTGNMYVMHVLGSGNGPRLLQAAPDTPVARILSAEIIRGNPAYFGGGKSASEAIAEIHRRVGGRAASVPAGRGGAGADADGIGDAQLLRDEALLLRQEAAAMKIAGMDMNSIFSRSFDPSEIDVDAGLMQFKAGGDAFGVTERLQGVTQWNPVLAGRAIVWEAADGRRLIADGHQRLGLAKRIRAQDPSQTVAIDALVLRESDGWDAESVRVWAALKNVAEGSGSMVDAAKVMRSIGPDQAMLYLPPRSPLVRDAGGLSRLGDDAFGMVVNELVDPSHAAIVGRLLSEPGEQKALIDLLVKLQPQTMSQADSIVRQGIAAGFTREEQFDMFGALDSTASLFLERARILERGVGELKKLKQIHSVAAKNADALEKSGSKIDRKASEKETIDNATAIDLVERLAFSAGPVKEIIDRAAAELAGGQRIAGVIGRFVRDIRALDFTALARSGGDAIDGGLAGGAGRAGNAGEADGGPLPSAGYSREPDALDGAWPRRDEIDSGIERGFDAFDPEQGKLFDGPASEGPKLQADSLAHDAKIAEDRVREAIAIAQAVGELEPVVPARRVAKISDARELADAFRTQPLTNAETGIAATISRRTLDKMVSRSAASKSSTPADHAMAIANIDQLFPVAREVSATADVRGEPTIAAIRRYVAVMARGKDDAVAVRMMVKETVHPGEPNPLYTIETIELERIGRSAPDAPPEGGIVRAAEPGRTTPRDEPADDIGVSPSDGNVDPAIAARQAQEAELRAASPLRGDAEQDGTMGLGLFDRVDQAELGLRAAADESGQPRFLVDRGDGEPVERTIDELLDEFQANQAAIEAAKKCL